MWKKKTKEKNYSLNQSLCYRCITNNMIRTEKLNTHFENENQWNIKQFFLVGNSYHNTSIRKIMENHILKNTSIKTMISSLKTTYVGNLKRQ